MATKAVCCRLCWEQVAENRMTHLYTRKSMERGWASRITALLKVPISQHDLPPHVCNKCISRFVSLEKAAIELAAFKRSAMSVLQKAQQPLKRTRETTDTLGVSPDTLQSRPRSKIPRRLCFTSIECIIIFTNKINDKQCT